MFSYPRLLGGEDDDAKTKERRSQHKNFSSPAPSRLFPFLPSVRTPLRPLVLLFLLFSSVPLPLPCLARFIPKRDRDGEEREQRGERATKPGFLIKAGLSLFSPSN